MHSTFFSSLLPGLLKSVAIAFPVIFSGQKPNNVQSPQDHIASANPFAMNFHLIEKSSTRASTVAANFGELTSTKGMPHVIKTTSTKLSGNTMFSADWKFNYEHEGLTYKIFSASFPGDINNDGFDDVIVQATTESEGLHSVFVFLGSENGISTEPDQQFHGLGGLYSRMSGVGDVNGDGFNDATYGAFNLYSGTDTGLSSTPIPLGPTIDSEFWDNYAPYMDADYTTMGSPAGDVNGDGIDDMIFRMELNNISYVIHGSTTEFSSTPDWISLRDPIGFEGPSYSAASAGDINGDGFGDVYINSSSTVAYVYLGSADGLANSPNWTSLPLSDPGASQEFRKMEPGNYDGDGFNDMLISEKIFENFYNSERTKLKVYILRGSPAGLDTANPILLRDELVVSTSYYGPDLIPISSLQDLNEDGMSDMSIGNEIWFTYEPWEDYHFDKTYAEWPQVRLAGDLNGDNVPDLYYVDYKSLEIDYYHKPAIVSFPDSIKLCRNPQMQQHKVSMPITIQGNIHRVTYRQEGLFSTFVSDTDFNVNLNSGTTKINWKVIFIGGKTFDFSTVVDIQTTSFTDVSIKDGYAITGGDPNTIYVGYGADGFRLAALPEGGNGPYTYLWSNGSTEKNPRITETMPGEYRYWVNLTNAEGCTSSDTAIIKVENALCSSPLVDVVMSQYPTILQNPLLANLIKSNSKIAVCKDGETMCFTKDVVDIRITRNGYSIGACTPGVIPAEAFMTDEIENIFRGEMKVIVSPNPSSHSFQLNVVSIYNEPVMIRIMDLAGRQVEVLNNVSANQTITVGHKLRAGTYIAEVISGKERKVVKMVKMQ